MFSLRITKSYGLEIWLPIPNYEGYYEASTLGRIRSLDRYVTGKLDSIRKIQGYILQDADNGKGYRQVALSIHGIQKSHRVHDLVAETFLSNPNNLYEVNHKSESKTDNRVENLEYCTRQYNNNYGTHNAKISETLTNNIYTSKPILQFDLMGNLIAEYPSLSEVERQTGFSHGNISECCKGRRNKAYGFKWSYV